MPILGSPNYGAVADLIAALPTTVTAERQHRSLDVKTAARQMRLTPTTLANLETGTTKPTGLTIDAVLRWLATQGKV